MKVYEEVDFHLGEHVGYFLFIYIFRLNANSLLNPKNFMTYHWEWTYNQGLVEKSLVETGYNPALGAPSQNAQKVSLGKVDSKLIYIFIMDHNLLDVPMRAATKRFQRDLILSSTQGYIQTKNLSHAASAESRSRRKEIWKTMKEDILNKSNI